MIISFYIVCNNIYLVYIYIVYEYIYIVCYNICIAYSYIYIVYNLFLFYLLFIYLCVYKKYTNAGSVKALQRPSSTPPQIRDKINVR